ncbi:hypothetical protein FCIRC_11071 [Fusarium circinatum]|uniref:Uncharacterized protein n=1 Tax=Fusarium circinatum TaxID=48490 RepID=A0A8H5WIB3_FUSCI|nr:hypothetical protein FCIRC_11071 [Fusarium circinatum]
MCHPSLLHGCSYTAPALKVDEFSNSADEFYRPGENEEPRVLPRCCLCCFKFEPYDSIVVFNSRNPHLLNPWAGEYMEPESIEPIDRESTKRRRPLEKGYHSECVHLVAKGLPFGDSIHRTIKDRTGYGVGHNELLPSREAGRVRRLKKMFAQEFMVIVRYRLPLEICENIGRDCLSEYATKLINRVWSDKDFAGPQHATLRVTTSGSVWAQHVEFEGLQYIKSLSATRKSESDTKLFEATSDIRVNVYFAEDCLGIRDVVITEYDSIPSLNQDKDLRWVVSRRKALPFSFKYNTDGLKLRDLAMTKREDAGPNYRQRRWAVLPNDLNISRLAPPRPGCNFEVSNEPIRAVDWNLPGCSGYSVLIDQYSIYDIISHNMGGPSSRLVDVSNEHRGDWFYIPVDRDERIAELWLRSEDRGNKWNRNRKCLVMRTNKGRSFVLGFQGGEAGMFTYQPVTTLSLTDPSRMLCCKTKESGFWLGFEQAMTWDQHATCISLLSSSQFTPYQFKEILSWNAELRDVRTVAVCRNWRYSKNVGIVGMLLTYADGHQRSLGQIRLDYMEPPLTVSYGKIWLGCDKSENEPIPEGFWPRTNRIKWVEATLNGEATRSGAITATQCTYKANLTLEGLKLRNLDITQYEREYHYAQRTRWATLPRDLGYLRTPDDNIFESSHRAAVQAIDWNLYGVSGYVIGMQCSCIDSIFPYRPGKLPPAILGAYDNVRSNCLYFPVDPDERIFGLWLRSGDFPSDDDDDGLILSEALIVVTSNGLGLVFGPDIRRSDRPLNYEALADLPSTTPARTFYYKSDSHLDHQLGLAHTTGLANSFQRPPTLRTSKRLPHAAAGETYREPYLPTGHITWRGVCKPVLDSGIQHLEISVRGKLERRSTSHGKR